MLRTLLIAAALLSTSGAALARDGHDYGRVVSVEPHFSISFGTRHHDGFRVVYESGGEHYSTYTPYRPSHAIVLPPVHQAHYVYRTRDYGHDWNKRHQRHRGDWDDNRRENSRGHRDNRRHDRD
jgi:hypothetical protein